MMNKQMTVADFLAAMNETAEDWAISDSDQHVTVFSDGTVNVLHADGTSDDLTGQLSSVKARVRAKVQ